MVGGTMTTEQAISIFRQLAENYRGTWEEHQRLQEAIAVLEAKDTK